MTKNLHAHLIFATLALLIAVVALGDSPARAYQRCDDIADQLKNQIDGLKVGITAANTIYLSHPQASELSLGCSGRNFKNELYAKAYGRKPKPAFLDLVGSAAAIIFSLTKDETLTGVTRCINRMGCCAAIRSRCAIADSTLNAPVPRARHRLRSHAVRMSEEAWDGLSFGSGVKACCGATLLLALDRSCFWRLTTVDRSHRVLPPHRGFVFGSDLRAVALP